MGLRCALFGHQEEITGHYEEDEPGRLPITIRFRCRRCGAVRLEGFRMDDAFIDEESYHGVGWSGYSWWLHDPLKKPE